MIPPENSSGGIYLLQSYCVPGDQSESGVEGSRIVLRKGALYDPQEEQSDVPDCHAIFRLLGFNIEAESCTNDGRIDAVVQTDDHIYLFEFKLDDDDIALSQIKEKAYFKKYLQSSKKITMIGVNFDSEKGQLIDWQVEDVAE